MAKLIQLRSQAMHSFRLVGFAISFVASSVLFSAQASADQDANPPVVNAELADDFDGLLEEWNSLKVRLEIVSHASALENDPAKRKVLTKQFYEIKETMLPLIPLLTASAQATWERDPSPTADSLKWLTGHISIDYTNCRYPEALVLADAIYAHKEFVPTKERLNVSGIGALCAFNTNAFDRARFYLDEYQELDPVGTVFFTQLKSSVAEYAPLWTDELARREKDAEQGNLPLIALRTNGGLIAVELFANDCPEIVNTFIELSQSGYFGSHDLSRDDDRRMFEWTPPESGNAESQLATSLTTDQIGDRRQFSGSLTVRKENEKIDCTQFAFALSPPMQQDKNRVAIGRIVKGQEVLVSLASHMTKDWQNLGRVNQILLVRKPLSPEPQAE